MSNKGVEVKYIIMLGTSLVVQWLRLQLLLQGVPI